MQDQRSYLKVKIKSLAEEARIIRKEERVSKGERRRGLYLHRIGTVRRAARHTLLAYGFIRGRRYRQMEAKCATTPMWPEVFKMLVKYGLQDYGWKFWKRGEQEVVKEELLKRFEEWKSEK